MSILKIARMGHPVLARPAGPVDDPTAPEVRALVRDMLETLVDVGGLGLAAPQVHAPLRLVIFHLPLARAEAAGETESVDLTVLVNPVVEPLTDETASDWEGCLSVPGLRGLVPRYRSVRYSGLGLDGERIEREATGLHARIVQHECDHLDGILYPMRMTDLGKLVFESELERFLSESKRDERVGGSGDENGAA